MRCKFCFATFQDVKHSILPKGHLPKQDAIEVVSQLAEIGSSALPPNADCRVLNFFLYQKLIYKKYIFQKNSKKVMIFFFFS